MEKSLTIKDYLPDKKIPVEYSTYMHEEYVQHQEKRIFGISTDIMVKGNYLEFLDGSMDMYERFHTIFPYNEYYEFLDKHSLREQYFRLTHHNTGVTKQVDGRRLLIDLLGLYEFKDKKVLLDKTAVVCRKYGLLSWQKRLVVDDSDVMKEMKENRNRNINEELLFGFEISNIIMSIRQLMILYLIWKYLFLEVSKDEEYELGYLLRSLIGSFRFDTTNFKTFTVDEKEAARYTVGQNGVLEITEDTKDGYEQRIERILKRLNQDPSKPTYSRDSFGPFIPGTFTIKKEKKFSTIDYERAVSSFSTGVTAARRIVFNGNKTTVVPIYQNAFQAAFGVMLQIIESGIDGLEGRTIGKCSRCGKNYVKKHGNTKLCKDCATPNERLKAMRDREKIKREKGADRDGKESEQ